MMRSKPTTKPSRKRVNHDPRKKTITPREEWPVKKRGWLVIEDHSEDGTWSGYASSELGGNIVWDTEAIPITVNSPNTITLPRDVVEEMVQALRIAALGETQFDGVEAMHAARKALFSLKETGIDL